MKYGGDAPGMGLALFGRQHTVTDGKGETMAADLTAGGRGWFARALVWAALALLVLLCNNGCARSDPEQRLREQLARMQQALEDGNARGFMEGVAEDFIGRDGIDRAALQQGVRAQVLANSRLGVSLGPVQVRLQGGRATTEFTAVTTGGSGRGWLPERAQAWAVTAGWREEGGQWRLYHLDWERR